MPVQAHSLIFISQRNSSFRCWTSYSCYSAPEICMSLGWSFQCMNACMRVFIDTNSSLRRDSSILKVRHCPVQQLTLLQRTVKISLSRLTAANKQHPVSPPELSCIQSLIKKSAFIWFRLSLFTFYLLKTVA